MPILEQLPLKELLALLVKQTAHHTHLIAKGASADEFAESRAVLREIQMQIQFREFANETQEDTSNRY